MELMNFYPHQRQKCDRIFPNQHSLNPFPAVIPALKVGKILQKVRSRFSFKVTLVSSRQFDQIGKKISLGASQDIDESAILNFRHLGEVAEWLKAADC